jgi:hypothetical protein
MSDELDPQLLGLFRQADESLPGTEFQAQVLADLRRSRGPVDIAYAFGFFARAALAGIAAGIASPFELRHALRSVRIRPFIRT